VRISANAESGGAFSRTRMQIEISSSGDATDSTKSRDEWLKLLEEADVPCAPILTPAEVFDHPQIVENELIVEVDDLRVGKVKMMGIPLKLADAPGSIRRPAPDLGQHTDEILLEAGYDKARINQLRQKNIVA